MNLKILKRRAEMLDAVSTGFILQTHKSQRGTSDYPTYSAIALIKAFIVQLLPLRVTKHHPIRYDR